MSVAFAPTSRGHRRRADWRARVGSADLPAMFGIFRLGGRMFNDPESTIHKPAGWSLVSG